METNPCLEDVINNPKVNQTLLLRRRDEFVVVSGRNIITANNLPSGESYLGRTVPSALAEYYGKAVASRITSLLSRSEEGKDTVKDERGRVLEVMVNEPMQTKNQGERRIIAVSNKTEIYSEQLTGLHNQNYWLLFAETAYSIMARDIANVAIIDVDNLKEVNDTYGHETGDLILNTVGRNVREYFRRASDVSARTGGDEFKLVLSGKKRAVAKQFGRFAKKTIEDIAALLQDAANRKGLDGNKVYCGVSYGLVASIEGTGSERRQLDFLNAEEGADSRMYTMKRENYRRFLSRGYVPRNLQKT